MRQCSCQASMREVSVHSAHSMSPPVAWSHPPATSHHSTFQVAACSLHNPRSLPNPRSLHNPSKDTLGQLELLHMSRESGHMAYNATTRHVQGQAVHVPLSRSGLGW